MLSLWKQIIDSDGINCFNCATNSGKPLDGWDKLNFWRNFFSLKEIQASSQKALTDRLTGSVK